MDPNVYEKNLSQAYHGVYILFTWSFLGQQVSLETTQPARPNKTDGIYIINVCLLYSELFC